MSFATEALCLTKKDEKRLRVFERKIQGPRKLEGGPLKGEDGLYGGKGATNWLVLARHIEKARTQGESNDGGQQIGEDQGISVIKSVGIERRRGQ